MAKQVRRKIRTAPWIDSIEINTYSRRITVNAVAYAGSTRYAVNMELSPFQTRRVILELRKGLREIRDESTRDLNEQVAAAEAPL